MAGINPSTVNNGNGTAKPDNEVAKLGITLTPLALSLTHHLPFVTNSFFIVFKSNNNNNNRT
jgi:hypothetical protein